MKQKALRAGVAHSHEDEECRKRLLGARMCRGTFFLIIGKLRGFSEQNVKKGRKEKWNRKC